MSGDSLLHPSGTFLVASLVFNFVFAVIGYGLAERAARRFGRHVWGLPSPVWALLWFVSWLIGGILFLIAYNKTKSQLAQPYSRYQSPYPVGGSLPSGLVTGAPPAMPPGWHPDPSGRFQYRWWTGSQWTTSVAADGQQFIDNNPDQRL